MRRCSPSSSEGALTSLRPDLPLGRQDGGAPSLDKFLDQIGHRYQIIIMFLLSANSIPIVVNHLLMAFYAVATPHNCRVIKIWLTFIDFSIPYKISIRNCPVELIIMQILTTAPG